MIPTPNTGILITLALLKRLANFLDRSGGARGLLEIYLSIIEYANNHQDIHKNIGGIGD